MKSNGEIVEIKYQYSVLEIIKIKMKNFIIIMKVEIQLV